MGANLRIIVTKEMGVHGCRETVRGRGGSEEGCVKLAFLSNPSGSSRKALAHAFFFSFNLIGWKVLDMQS